MIDNPDFHFGTEDWDITDEALRAQDWESAPYLIPPRVSRSEPGVAELHRTVRVEFNGESHVYEPAEFATKLYMEAVGGKTEIRFTDMDGNPVELRRVG